MNCISAIINERKWHEKFCIKLRERVLRMVHFVKKRLLDIF